MSDRWLPIVAALGALILTGGGVLARSRRGEPVGRMALVWAAIFAAAFAVALTVGR